MGESEASFRVNYTIIDSNSVIVTVIQDTPNLGETKVYGGKIILEREYKSMYIAQEQAKNTINKALKKLRLEKEGK